MGKAMGFDKGKITEYLYNTRLVVLATVCEGRPFLRTLAAFAADGVAPVFSTHKDTAKVRQIAVNPYVSVLFQHENQSFRKFVNITISGMAVRMDAEVEKERIVRLIGMKNQRYRERELQGELIEQVVYRIEPYEIKIIDFSKAPSPEGIEIINLQNDSGNVRAA